MDHRQPHLNRTLALLAALLLSLPAAADIWDRASRPDPGFLPVDEAFVIQPAERHGDQLRLAWRIEPEHYLYQHAVTVRAAGAQFGAARFENGEPYVDEHFGQVMIHRGEMVVWVPVTAGEPRTVDVSYQGCADAGLCYPPQSRSLEVERR